MTLSLTMNETLKWLSLLPILMQKSFGGDSVAIGIESPSPPTSISPYPISLMVSVDIKHHVYLKEALRAMW